MHLAPSLAPTLRPTLVLGMIGFSPLHEARVRDHLGTHAEAALGWRVGPLAEADAWWANGGRTRLLDDGSLRIGAGQPGGRSVHLTLADVHRPLAFSEPAAASAFEPAYSFRLGDAASMDSVLSLMATQWLGSTVVRLWLAACLVAHERALRDPVYHVVHAGRLLAIVDRAGEVGLAPGIRLDEVQQASWVGRPASARFIPATFQRTTIPELAWCYAQRCEADLLPARYRSADIFLRRPPQVAQRLLADEHLLVLRELATGPASFDELRRRTGLETGRLARALAAFYLSGSITSNPDRASRASAWQAVQAGTTDPSDESLGSSSPDSSRLGIPWPARGADFTPDSP